MEFQTRSEEKGLRFHKTFTEAFIESQKDPGVWKISFSIGNERIRLTRNGPNNWSYDPIDVGGIANGNR